MIARIGPDCTYFDLLYNKLYDKLHNKSNNNKSKYIVEFGRDWRMQPVFPVEMRCSPQ